MVTPRFDTHLEEPLVKENPFRGAGPDPEPIRAFEEARSALPEPVWEGSEDVLACYRRAWELAFSNLRTPEPASGFVSSFVDTAFNECLFMWDSAFIVLFCRYGRRAFGFQRTLDNLYAKQHPDGFICREIDTHTGEDRFERFDPASTGPNVLPWAEWEYYRDTGDVERLACVFPALLAYHRWTRRFRTWRDGSHWTSGLGSGMDNQPRFAGTREERLFTHGHLVWADACLQQAFAAGILTEMARILGREAPDLPAERERLVRYANERLWDERSAFYHDALPDGSLSNMKSVGAYWALLAGAVPRERLERFVGHLENPGEFSRPHRVPSLSADHPEYRADGGYWLGGVWPPTNYMLLRGLERVGRWDLAHEIGRNHLENVTRVFERTGTLWENYAPEREEPGNPARDDFVGWSGLGPVAVLLEQVLGLHPDAPAGRLLWDVRLLEEHGVLRYPFGARGTLDLLCRARSSPLEEPRIEASSSTPLELVVRWEGKEKTLHL
ncbi:MGH1-like glycoside hydrolase domain-containing protein [Rubrobacter calidifluminis]|uniref:MGH1-like glycoside hydrolase domain-containing protein n=1 Tax=Rubrobacter calidifluminis TaxID=1392640 RepID=UPI00235FFAE5|nr:trehalase family glycosidase [Rubrobacter calidifluminis]